MKQMIRHFKIFALFGLLAHLASCSQETTADTIAALGEELKLKPLIAEVEPAVRGYANEFFDVGHEIDVKILSSAPDAEEETYTYVYNSSGIFMGAPGYRFALNNTYIQTLVATWPDQGIRGQGIDTDQREYEVFRQADWLVAVATSGGIMPTEAAVPLFFERQNALLEFELVGQNTIGVDIKSLVVELEIGGQPTACWAYCGNEDGHAYLILENGTRIKADEAYLVGRVTVDDNAPYTIIMPQTDVTLEAGKRYLVTLTPTGYDMSMFAVIGDWTQGDEGIGIPFSPPVPDENGEFSIEDPMQLITMSYLIRHYNNPASFDWRTRIYNIADDFVLTEEYAEQYIQIPVGMFTGHIRQNGVDITELPYGTLQTLQLYE